MDFFMKSTTATFPVKESHHLIAESTILRIYELFVRTTYDDSEETSSMRANVPDDNRTDSPSSTILDRIDEFTRAINQRGVNLLRDIPNHFSQELSVRTRFI
jgi:hypothetical protein